MSGRSWRDPITGPCDNCKTYPAVMVWASSVSDANHGNFAWWCDICALREQVRHAEERASDLDRLRNQLARAEASAVVWSTKP